MSQQLTTQDKRKFILDVAEGKINPMNRDKEKVYIWYQALDGPYEGRINDKPVELTREQFEAFMSKHGSKHVVLKAPLAKGCAPMEDLSYPESIQEHEPKELEEKIFEPVESLDSSPPEPEPVSDNFIVIGDVRPERTFKLSDAEFLDWENIPKESAIGWMFPRR